MRTVLKIKTSSHRYIVGVEIDGNIFRMSPLKGGHPTKEVFAEILQYLKIGQKEGGCPISDWPYQIITREGSSGCYTVGIQYFEPKAFGFYATITKWVLHISMYNKIGTMEVGIDELECAINALCAADIDFCRSFTCPITSSITEIEEIKPV